MYFLLFHCCTVSGIKFGGILHQDSKSMANIFNPQFKSVFTKEKNTDKLPKMDGEKYPGMKGINIETHGVEKLLKNITPKSKWTYYGYQV